MLKALYERTGPRLFEKQWGLRDETHCVVDIDHVRLEEGWA